MDALRRDLKLALRRLRREPVFALVAVLSMTVAIGANTAIFSLVNAVLLRKPPVPHAERVLDVSFRAPDLPYLPFSYPELQDFRRASGAVYSHVSAARLAIIPHTLRDRVETLPVELVNGDYFPLLGLRPAAGRLLGPEDDAAPGASPVVVLSYRYWTNAYAADPHVVGTGIRLAGHLYTIVGVAPRSYTGSLRGLDPSLFVPLTMVNQVSHEAEDQLADRGTLAIFVRGRLRAGVGIAQAGAQAAAFVQAETHDYPNDWQAGTTARLTPLPDVAVSPLIDGVVKGASVLLMVIVGLVLLIACANLASFLLARARDREREIAVRLALGARRGTLVRQMLTETMLLAMIGAVGGALLARWLLHLLLSAHLPFPLPITLDVAPDARVLGFAAAVTVGAGLLLGLAPALHAARTTVIETIKSENTGGGPRRLTVRQALVVGQVAVSLVLLIAAGLFLRSLQAREAVDPGFGHQPGVVATVSFPSDRYPPARMPALLERVEQALGAGPDVAAVGATSNLQLNVLGFSETPVTVPGVEPPPGQSFIAVGSARVDTGFFGAAGIPLVRGRGFGSGAGDSGQVIVSETMARQFWPGRDPLGQSFRADSQTVTVRGVARDTKVRSLGEPPRPFLYLPMSGARAGSPTLVVRVRRDAERAMPTVLGTLRALAPDAIVLQITTLDRRLAGLVLPARLGAALIAAFALLAVALAIIGVYGVVRYAVARRTREVAIRMSLGAAPGSVLRLLIRQGVVLVAAGAGIGLAAGWVLARTVRAFLFGVGATDALSFVALPVLLVAVGLAAAFLPARRATRLDPARVLRGD